MRASLPLLASALSLALASCLIYDESLLSGGAGGTGGDGGSGATGNQGGGGSGNQGGGGAGNQGGGGTGNQGGGGSGGCTNPSQCPGDDGDCQSRTCQGGVCGIMLVPMGTAIASQTAGDCKKLVCDGQGNVVSQDDDGDTPNDGKQCTTDDCTLGMPSNTPIGEGSPCNQGGQVCNAAGDCVECVDGMDCVSTVCDVMTFTCSPASCSDMVKNGSETATDCGGSCPGCALGQACMAASDCLSNSCVGLQCAPSCTDGMQNQTESDTDCGGTCAPCATGLNCNAGSDCETGHCDVGGVCACSPVCACHLVISEIRTRGVDGNDEAIELFNPLNVPVVMDDQWKLVVLSASANPPVPPMPALPPDNYTPRWVGSAVSPLVIPPKGHLLIGRSAAFYQGSPAADAFFTTNTGIADAASVVLTHAGVVVDAICFGVTATEIGYLANASAYVCEGPAFDKSATQDTRTLERKPGGANGGSCTDTDSSTADFIENLTPNFQNLSSPPTP